MQLDAIIVNMNTRLTVVEDQLKVSSVGGSANAYMRDVIGNKDDMHGSETLFGHLHDIWNMQHSAQLVYPTLAAAVTITANGAVWTLGAFAEIVPANVITSGFHIHHLHVTAPSVNGDYELALYQVSTEIGRITFSRTDKKDDVEGLPVRTTVSDANAQIRAKLACSVGGATAKLKVWYHLHS